ncbi:hypothetical protein HYV44_00375 [Candidatus Microgenomates bacterium]|nr:hypothetical protein [Candidatus Microgenomates bacterium]
MSAFDDLYLYFDAKYGVRLMGALANIYGEEVKDFVDFLLDNTDALSEATFPYTPRVFTHQCPEPKTLKAERYVKLAAKRHLLVKAFVEMCIRHKNPMARATGIEAIVNGIIHNGFCRERLPFKAWPIEIDHKGKKGPFTVTGAWVEWRRIIVCCSDGKRGCLLAIDADTNTPSFWGQPFDKPIEVIGSPQKSYSDAITVHLHSSGDSALFLLNYGVGTWREQVAWHDEKKTLTTEEANFLKHHLRYEKKENSDFGAFSNVPDHPGVWELSYGDHFIDSLRNLTLRIFSQKDALWLTSTKQ